MTLSLRASAFALCLSLQALGGATAAAADAPNVPSNDYLDALRTADGFAWAWANRDATGGAKLVAPAVRAKSGATALASYFQGTSSPQHWAFDLAPGTLVRLGTYRFNVRLYSYLFAGGGFAQSSKASVLTVSKAADGHWYVGGLP
jgi:hypothetical protein